MPALREQDFDKLASQVVDAYLSKRSKLADAAAQVAMDNRLNPDQIERLSQAANTQTFLRMMENTKAQGGQDLTEEFDPIDSGQVIRIVIDNTGVHVNADPSVDVQGGNQDGPMPGSENELPDEMAALRGEEAAPPPLSGSEEEVDDTDGEAPAKKTDKKDKKDSKKSEKEAMFRKLRLRKLAGVLEDQRRQADIYFEDTAEKLAARFRKLYSAMNYDAFEKDALAEHGDEYGIQIINAMRDTRKLPPLSVDNARSKIAALEDRHVSTDSAELALFGELVKTAREATRLEKGIAVLRSQCA
jgi:hypothetical protein